METILEFQHVPIFGDSLNARPKTLPTPQHQVYVHFPFQWIFNDQKARGDASIEDERSCWTVSIPITWKRVQMLFSLNHLLHLQSSGIENSEIQELRKCSRQWKRWREFLQWTKRSEQEPTHCLHCFKHQTFSSPAKRLKNYQSVWTYAQKYDRQNFNTIV